MTSKPLARQHIRSALSKAKDPVVLVYSRERRRPKGVAVLRHVATIRVADLKVLLEGR